MADDLYDLLGQYYGELYAAWVQSQDKILRLKILEEIRQRMISQMAKREGERLAGWMEIIELILKDEN